MENIIFETPVGHKVTIKPTLSYPEKRRIQRVFFSGVAINPQTGENTLDGGVQIDAQDTLLKIMVKRLQLVDGRTLEGGDVIFNGFSELAYRDIQAIYDKLDELTRTLDIFPNPEREKKESA